MEIQARGDAQQKASEGGVLRMEWHRIAGLNTCAPSALATTEDQHVGPTKTKERVLRISAPLAEELWSCILRRECRPHGFFVRYDSYMDIQPY